MPGGSRRQLPPTRRCQVIAPTMGKAGVAVPLRGGSTRSSQRATFLTAHVATTCFRFASWRARCYCVHISLPPRPDRRITVPSKEMGCAADLPVPAKTELVDSEAILRAEPSIDCRRVAGRQERRRGRRRWQQALRPQRNPRPRGGALAVGPWPSALCARRAAQPGQQPTRLLSRHG